MSNLPSNNAALLNNSHGFGQKSKNSNRSKRPKGRHGYVQIPTATGDMEIGYSLESVSTTKPSSRRAPSPFILGGENPQDDDDCSSSDSEESKIQGDAASHISKASKSSTVSSKSSLLSYYY